MEPGWLWRLLLHWDLQFQLYHAIVKRIGNKNVTIFICRDAPRGVEAASKYLDAAVRFAANRNLLYSVVSSVGDEYVSSLIRCNTARALEATAECQNAIGG